MVMFGVLFMWYFVNSFIVGIISKDDITITKHKTLYTVMSIGYIVFRRLFRK